MNTKKKLLQGEDLEMPAFPFAEAYNVLATNGALLYSVFRDRALDVTRFEIK